MSTDDNTKTKRRSSLSNEKTKAEMSDELFSVGDLVRVQDKEDKNEYNDGTILRRHTNGEYTVEYTDSKKIEKQIAPDRIQPIKRKKKKKEGDEEEKEETMVYKEGDNVLYRGAKDDDWREGVVKIVRNGGTYDIIDTETEEVISKVEEIKKKKIQKKKKKNKEDDQEDSDDSSRAVRKRKKSTKKDQESSNDTEEEKPKKGRHQRRSSHPPVLFTQLARQQVVEFETKGDGNWQRGRIVLLRRDDKTCDIALLSDPKRVTKRVPMESIRVVSILSRLWNSNPSILTINTRVLYQYQDEEEERKGVIIKVWRENGIFYDIEDLVDDTLTVRKLDAHHVRPMPWLPNMNLPSLPNVNLRQFLPQTILRKGMQVKFRRSSRQNRWEYGVILKAKADGTCLIQVSNSDRKEEETIVLANSDIQAIFQSPFSGMFDNLSMPTLQLPQGLLSVKTPVEVRTMNGDKVYMGTIYSVQETEQTYTIQYEDGKKEKNVAMTRVRVSLRRLRIGTAVDMIVEGPCKEVSKLEGEVAWVHRDETVAVRINGGNNDVFAQVCTHALMVDGQPAFSAPLSSTWSDWIQYFLLLGIEMIVFIWFLFGMIIEIGGMIRVWSAMAPETLADPTVLASFHLDHCTILQNQTLMIPPGLFTTDRSWLVIMIILKIVLTLSCAIFSYRLLTSKVVAIQDNFIDVREYQQDRVLRRHFAHIMGITILISYWTILIYTSLFNRLEAICLFHPSTDIRFDSIALDQYGISFHGTYHTSVDLLMGLCATSIFNLFRVIALYILIFAFPTSNFILRILSLIPSILLTILMCAMGIAALNVFYYIQRTEILHYGIYTITSNIDWAIILVLVGIWFNISIYRLVAATSGYYETRKERERNQRGEITEDLLDQAERGEFGLQAKKEALYSRVELRQEQLGILKLSLLRIQRQIGLHVSSMIIGIIATVHLRNVVLPEYTTALSGLTLQLIFCILWLLMTLVASFFARTVKQEVPDLQTYLLDV